MRKKIKGNDKFCFGVLCVHIIYGTNELVRMISWLTIFFAVLLPAITAEDPCRFEYIPFGVIDLTSLGNTDGTPVFAASSSPWSMFICCFSIFIIQCLLIIAYTYNPCKPFTEKPGCINVSVCQSLLIISFDFLFYLEMYLAQEPIGYRFVLGAQNSTKWDPGDGSGVMPSISYSYERKIVKVVLKCSDSRIAKFQVLGEAPINTYLLAVTHKCACWNGCSDGKSLLITMIYFYYLSYEFI
jgi:hypothetical protein